MLKLENTPEGRVVSWFLLRDEERMKMKMREGRSESEDGGTRAGARERVELFEVGKHSRWKGCQLVVMKR